MAPVKKSKRKPKRWQWAAAAAITTIVIGGGLAYRYLSDSFDGDRAVTIFVPQSITGEALRDSLSLHLSEPLAGKVYSIIGDATKAKAGAYTVTPGMAAWRIARNISRGNQSPVNVTYNNVTDMDALAERISARMMFSKEEFSHTADSILTAEGYTTDERMTAFLPDTYQFFWNDSPRKVINKLHDYASQWWTDERKAKAEKLGLTPREVIILASIVEEESSKRDEYGKIARLYINRLDRGMKLQADPTVKRAVGDRTIRRVTAAHLRANSPYNTYIHKGLPPGPLRIADARTIESVLDAPHHNYLYMCASPDFSGYHIFAEDYDTHRANARRYQAALDARGIH